MDIIEGYTPGCPLCRLVQDGEIITRLHYQDMDLILVDCLICRVPMAVAKAHRNTFTPLEAEKIKELFKILTLRHKDASIFDSEHPPICLHSSLAEDEQWLTADYHWIIDWEQRRIPDHPHCHLRPFPFHGTLHWEYLD